MNSFKSKLAMFEASATKGVKKPQKAKNSKIKYEGEYVNGIKEGKGKEYRNTPPKLKADERGCR